MWGLFHVTFDHYRWDDLICVSPNKEKLEQYYASQGFNEPLLTEEASEELMEELEHYMIKKIDVI